MGLYIGKNPPRDEGEYQPMFFEGENMKRGREIVRKCKRKRKKGVIKERKEDKEKMEAKCKIGEN